MSGNLTEALKFSRQLLTESRKKENIHLNINNEISEIYAIPQNKIYIPTETGRLFDADDAFVSLIMGPYGSGKSTACINKIVRRACAMPFWTATGRRRSRWGIVRNTSGELQSTTLKTWLDWFGELGDVRKKQKPILTYEHHFNDGRGIVELELLFIALDRPDDVRKIKSLELTGCYINEMSEVPQAALSHMKGRVNRYPSHGLCKQPYWAGVIADTNPPDDDHWIVKDFEESENSTYKIFKQPPGLVKDDDGIWVRNPDADNINNLPIDYYENLASKQTEEFVKVFCLGQYGSVGFGKRVYPEYNDDIHSVDELEAIQGVPIHVGWDGGLTPACVIVQITPRGQLYVLKEYKVEDMGIRTFVESIVLPGLARDFPYNKIDVSRADPSGNRRDDIMEELSFIGELNSLGITTIGARTNDLDPRISSVRFFLNRMIDGKPGFVLSRKGCPTIRKGFIKDYVYKRLAVSGEERYRNVPDKNMASHPHDALQYICMEFAADKISQDKTSNKTVDIYNPVMRIF